MLTDRPIQSLWIGDRLSNIEILCIRSFLHHGHNFILYTYTDVENVPKGVLIRDASKIMLFDSKFKTKQGSYAPFADLFRLKMLYQNGGWWVDMDVVCLKNLNDLPVNCIATSFERQFGDYANSNVLSFEQGHPFLIHCINIWSNISNDNLYHGLGPDIVKQTVNDLQAYHLLLPHEVFNPVSYFHAKYLYSINFYLRPIFNIYKLFKRDYLIEKPTKKSYAVHLWNEMIRAQNIDKNATFPYFSLIEILKRKYL